MNGGDGWDSPRVPFALTAATRNTYQCAVATTPRAVTVVLAACIKGVHGPKLSVLKNGPK